MIKYGIYFPIYNSFCNADCGSDKFRSYKNDKNQFETVDINTAFQYREALNKFVGLNQIVEVREII